jgi:hypothetical protein
MANGDAKTNGESKISFPRWALAFFVPAALVIAMFAVNNYRQGQVEMNVVKLDKNNAIQHREMQETTNKAIDKFTVAQENATVKLAKIETKLERIERKVGE